MEACFLLLMIRSSQRIGLLVLVLVLVVAVCSIAVTITALPFSWSTGEEKWGTKATT